MKFIKTKIKGAFIIELEKQEDTRGYLARTWDIKEFAKNGIKMDLVQGYVSHTNKKGTIRGIHYQVKPFAEAKLTRCTKGAIFELVVDLRKKSPTYKKWQGFTLKAKDNKMLFTPPNCGHAILTLADETDFINFSNQPYMSEYEHGIRYDDPAFAIKWPIKVRAVSGKDLSWKGFDKSKI